MRRFQRDSIAELNARFHLKFCTRRLNNSSVAMQLLPTLASQRFKMSTKEAVVDKSVSIFLSFAWSSVQALDTIIFGRTEIVDRRREDWIEAKRSGHVTMPLSRPRLSIHRPCRRGAMNNRLYSSNVAVRMVLLTNGAELRSQNSDSERLHFCRLFTLRFKEKCHYDI